ncbi:MAG: hypothetical protein E6J41_10140 [Chloroflexi bacterium]|nr:MAG: hypothetical protein E6J41_10140 [Chloroflexota bacterium]
MSKIVRYRFLGNSYWFWLLCVSVVGLPVALLYMLHGTIRIEEELDDPERFIEEFRAGRLGRR